MRFSPRDFQNPTSKSIDLFYVEDKIFQITLTSSEGGMEAQHRIPNPRLLAWDGPLTLGKGWNGGEILRPSSLDSGWRISTVSLFGNSQISPRPSCESLACLEAAQEACSARHPCGHHCLGVRREVNHLPCLYPHCLPQPSPEAQGISQTKDSLCGICMADVLESSPSHQIE